MTRGACRTVALAAWIVLISPPAFGQDAGALDPEAREAIRKAIDLSHRPKRKDLSDEERALIAEAIRTQRALRDAARLSEVEPFRARGGSAAASAGAESTAPVHSSEEGTLRAQARQVRVVLENTPSGAGGNDEITRLRDRLATYASEMETIESLPDPATRQRRLRELLEQVDPEDEDASSYPPFLRRAKPFGELEAPEIPDFVVRHGR